MKKPPVSKILCSWPAMWRPSLSGLSRIFLIAGAVVFGATAGASGPSVASAKAHQAYELNWVIAPHDFPSEPLLLKKRSRIVETRLYPETLFQTPVELKAENGELVAPVGAQFIRLESDAFIACSIAKGQVGLVSKGRICLVDQDDDRRFDGFFKRGFGEYWWFELSGQIPENLRAMAPVALPSGPRTGCALPIAKTSLPSGRRIFHRSSRTVSPRRIARERGSSLEG